MVGLKFIEASKVPGEVVSETIAPSEALNTGVTGIDLNLIFEDDFDYTTLNHISPTTLPIPSPNQSLKHIYLPVDETIVAQNQLVEFVLKNNLHPLTLCLNPP